MPVGSAFLYGPFQLRLQLVRIDGPEQSVSVDENSSANFDNIRSIVSKNPTRLGSFPHTDTSGVCSIREAGTGSAPML